MIDYFALLDEVRRPWLVPEKLKEKYFALSRVAAPDAQLNEAYRVLSDPQLRLHHLLILEGADLVAGRPVPPSVAELFWNTGTLLREVERWLLQNSGATAALSRSLLKAERAKLEEKLNSLEEQLRATHESELEQLRQLDAAWSSASPNEMPKLVHLYDSISYLTRLLERTADEFPEIRRLAGRVLEQIGPAAAPAADALGQAILVEREEDIRAQFVEALLAMGPGAKPALRGLLPLVAEKGLATSLRARAAVAVAVADPASPGVAAALVKAAGDDELDVRVAAADALGRLDPLPPNALDTLVKMAKTDAKNGPRVAALRALAAAGPRALAAKPDLDAMAAGPQPGLALWAQVARAAVDGNLASATPAITTGLTDRNVQVRAAASETLLLIPARAEDLPSLLKLLKDANGSTRAAAATGLGRLGGRAKEAEPQLVRQLDDTDPEVRVAAAEAIGAIGVASKAGVAKLKGLRADPQVRFAAQRALDKLAAK